MKEGDSQAPGDTTPSNRPTAHQKKPSPGSPGTLFSRIRDRGTTKRVRRRFEPETPENQVFELPCVSPEVRHNGLPTCIVIGNCQARALTTALQALCPTVVYSAAELPPAAAQRIAQRDKTFLKTLSEYDSILVQMAHAPLFAENFPELRPKMVGFPFIGFAAYHPDLVYVNDGDLHGPFGQYNSAIALWGYLRGLSVTETVGLFNAQVYEALGYYNFWRSSYQSVLNQGVIARVPLRDYLERWTRSGCFMYSVNHPKIYVFTDLAQHLLTKFGTRHFPEGACYAADEFADGAVWPVYPEIGDRLGVAGNYLFKIEKGRCPPGRSVMMLDLREFIEGSFEAFGEYDRHELRCERLESGRFDALASMAAARSRSPGVAATYDGKPRMTPYTGLPAHQFWRSAVTNVPWWEVDPVVRGAFQVTKDTRVATAGSCFAQNISAALQRFGFNYFVTERGEELSQEESQRRLFGVYSARYGNVYTARQLLQLFERAYGRFQPVDSVWERPDGRFVDPFRPLIEPDGFVSAELVEQSRSVHLAKVRELFEQLDVFIFTLGLTEAWTSKIDGAVFPVAPGVSGGAVDFTQHEFVNLQVAEVVRDLQRFLVLLREVNQRARMILTVSPVPLLATYEPEHALVATTYSKSVLRAAAGETCARNANCVYFPSYEIITGNYSRGAYYDTDLRSVTRAGVEHVMRLFFKHYASEQGTESVDPTLMKELDSVREIFCDEQAIDS